MLLLKLNDKRIVNAHRKCNLYSMKNSVRKRERENSRRFINVKTISIEIPWTFCSFYVCFVVFGEYKISSRLKSSFDSLVCRYDNSIGIGISTIYSWNLSARFGSQLLHRLLIAKLICTYTCTLPTRCTRSHITCILIGVGFEIGNIENKRWSLKQILFVCIRINK